MRVFVLSALAAGLTLGAGPARAQDAKAIIEKAIGAHGGATNLDKYKAGRLTSKGNIDLGGTDIEFTGETVFQLPDKQKTTIKAKANEMEFMVVQLVNGGKVSQTVNGTAEEISPEQKGEMLESLYVQRVNQFTPLLKDPAFQLKALGESKVNDKPAVGVEVTAKDHKDLKLFFDKDSGLLVKVEGMGLNPAGGKVKQEVFYSEFKEFDGVKRPTKTEVRHDGTKFLTATTTAMKLLDKVDEKEFSD
jgi:hypothetical protein